MCFSPTCTVMPM